MKWSNLFRRRPDKFLRLLCAQAEHTRLGLEALSAYMREPASAVAKQIHFEEKEADETRRILMDELNRTFITPIDREDIFSLSRAVDDVLDYADTTVEEMLTLGVAPNAYLVRMASLLADAAQEIHRGVPRLLRQPNVASDHVVRAKALENRVGSVYREAIAALFAGPRDVDHVVDMLKLREINRHLSNAADRGDEAANVIGDVMVKHL